MRPFVVFIFFMLFILSMDLFALRGINYLLPSFRNNNPWFSFLYWGLSILMLLALLIAGNRFQNLREPSRFIGVMIIMGIFLMLYVPKLMFNLVQLMANLANLLAGAFGHQGQSLKKGIMLAGAGLAVFTFISFGMGMVRGRTNVKVIHEPIKILNLPPGLEGLKIVQLSDIHLAGFYRHPAFIERAVKMVNELEPDLICFTGDMIYTFSEEIDPFTDILNELEAPLGKYAILGNHDYGTYFNWESKQEEAANLERVKKQIRNAGFDLLLNENRIISLNGDSLAVIGVENWGKPPFPQLGDLSAAMAGVHPELVKILMSHDPSHWDLQVDNREDIDLTLSGHTHGMQFGIEIGKFRWSPSKWTYKHWAGLYGENGQQLYVNRGLGFTGYPGRVGIRPEITLLTLQSE